METVKPFQFHSELQKARLGATPELPSVLAAPSTNGVREKNRTTAAADEQEIERLFPRTYGQPYLHLESVDEVWSTQEACQGTPLRVGVVLSGGQAPGGHNVIAGVYDRIKRIHPDSKLIGFLEGPHGLFTGNYREIDEAAIDSYRQQGGFDMIGSGRHKIETEAQFAASRECCEKLGLTGVIVIGGDDSNTNAALLAENFAENNIKTSVIGCPKTIDGDLKNEVVQVSFGFDTACKVYSELIGIIMLDVAASKKYWHFCRLMGRSASHITLECALQTHPNVVIIGEEVKANHTSLSEITNSLVDAVIQRAAQGKTYGVVLLPEGLIEFVPELEVLVSELNETLAAATVAGEASDEDSISSKLSPQSCQLFNFLPGSIKRQLLMDRDPHGNVQVSKIETEQLLIQLVQQVLDERQRSGQVEKVPFRAQAHFFGYEGRAALPSLFDSTYCYALGHTAACLIETSASGMIAAVKNLTKPVAEWSCGGAPITMMLNVERRHGKNKPVIKKALTELDGVPFKLLCSMRARWLAEDCYVSPGPIQFAGPGSTNPSITLALEIAPSDEIERVTELVRGNRGLLQQLREADAVQQPDELLNLSKLRLQPQVVAKSKTANLLARPFLRKAFPNLTGGADGRGQPLLHVVQPGTSGAEVAAAVTPPAAADPRKLRVGVVFCGRQCPAGHNVIAGLFDSLKELNPESMVIGFVGGTVGFFKQKHIEITADVMQSFRNQGGFHMLGRSVDMLLTPDQMASGMKACVDLSLDGLVLVGGSTSNGDACHFAEHLLANCVSTRVVAVPATAVRDFGFGRLETTLGYDTACKVFSELIGNLATDMISAKKYNYFVRLMGRSTSHITLECGLLVQPNVVLVNSEVTNEAQSLHDIVSYIADVICKRAALGRNYGLFVMSEGIIEAFVDTNQLIKEINAILKISGGGSRVDDKDSVVSQLTPWSKALYETLPPFIQEQMLLERESRGAVQVSQIDTEKLLAELVGRELQQRKKAGTYSGSFSAITHYMGYQGRSSFPSKFDCELGHAMGVVSTALVSNGFTGYCANLRDLLAPTDQWRMDPVPLTLLMKEGTHAYQVMLASGSEKDPNEALHRGAHIEKNDVPFSGTAFKTLKANRDAWETGDAFKNPGPIQLRGPCSDSRSMVLQLEQREAMEGMKAVEKAMSSIKDLCHAHRNQEVLLAAQTGLESLSEILGML